MADLIWHLARLAERAMADAGATTVTATSGDPTGLQACDGLLLVGGGDVDPRSYGGPVEHPAMSHVDAARDRFELAVLEAALAAGVPVLALCRGLQLLNVALGGSLTPQVPQDIVRHHGDNPATLMLTHPVTVADGTSLAHVVGAGHQRVWSGHHQGIDRLGRGLRVTAHAADGLVEAVEHETSSTFAVQWHPEVGHVPGIAPDALFVDLVERARLHRSQRM